MTEERLIQSDITGITHLFKRERAGEGKHDFYDFYDIWHEVLTAALTRFDILAPTPRTPLETIIDELDGLRSRTNSVPGHVFKPSKQAIRSAKFYIYETYAKMMGEFPRPSFVLDGKEGIIIKWTHNGHAVRLNCMGERGGQDYIYFENGEYDIEDNVTPETLHRRLNWLIHHEREPAR